MRWRPLVLAAAGLLALAAALSLAQAQGPMPAQAAALLEEAERHVTEALARDGPRTPDHPGWREALAIGRRALGEAEHVEVHRFLARTYAMVGWSVRALAHFHALLELGGSFDDPATVVAPEMTSRELYADSASDLGFARSQAGDLDAAAAIFERWLEVLPDDLRAVRRLGVVHLQRSDPEAALPHWERLAQADPDDATVAFNLGEARRGAVVGPEAAATFREGVVAFEGGAYQEALERFERALAVTPSFADAAVWAGRTALELQLPERALQHWERAVELRPEDTRAAYFLRVARDQATYGITAARAFHSGLEAYERDQLDEALAAFELAVAANEIYTAAWVWLARLRQEVGQYDAAVVAWERVTVLDPEDERARYFLAIARQQRSVGAAAGAVFAAGITAYEVSDFATAEMRFIEAVRIDPEAVDAWVWLGRVYFTLRRFDEAAVAFARASELDPDNAEIAFFATEAAVLAAPVEAPPEEEAGTESAAPPEEDAGSEDGAPPEEDAEADDAASQERDAP